jgi:hypothetical protein
MHAGMRFWLPLLAALFPALAGGATAQTPPPPVPATAALPRITLSAQSLAGLPRKTLAVVDENGKNVTYSGVDLGALLAAGGAPHGEALRGRAVADYVLVRAADGYRAVFALIELDPRFTDKVVLLADRQDGAAIGKDGPFRLVVPDEKHHARWVRNVVDVQVLSPP